MADRPSRIAHLAWAAAVVVIVGGIVAGVWWLGPDPVPQNAPAPPARTPPTVGAQRDYYLFVRLVEFKPTTPDGGRWDRGGSAPDAKVHIHWQDQRVFTLPEREDQLIAAWDLFRVDVKDLVLTGEIDVGAVVNGPIVRVGSGHSVTIEVWDDDPLSSDLALRMTIPLAELREGRNDITVPADSGVARLRIDMIDRATPLPQLIELDSNRG